MKKILFRRTKETETTDGKKLLELPPKKFHEITIKFSDDENQTYDAILAEIQVKFNDMLRMGKDVVLKFYLFFLTKLLRLRQSCDHLNLIVEENKDGNQKEKEKLPNFKCPTCHHKIVEGIVTSW